MVIYNMFCEINEPICLSEKLGLYLVNPLKRDGYYGRIKKMLYKNLSQEKKHSRKWEKKEYDIKKILMDSYWNGMFNISSKSDEKDCINEILNKIVMLVQFDIEGTIYDEFDEKRLHSEQIDEYSLEHKISMLQNWLPSMSGKNFTGILHDDERDSLFGTNSFLHILSGLELKIQKNGNFSIYKSKNNDEDVKNNKEEIFNFKSAIDSYIEEKSDFYKLDFIMDHLIEQTSHYQHFLSPFYIIEMILVNPKDSIRNQLKKKLKYFYNGDYDIIKNNMEKFACSIYDIRSKLVHGDFKNYEKEIQKYKRIFMKDYELDYFEFTENHWVIGNAAIMLDEIAKNLVMALLKSKNDMIKFKNDDKSSIYFK